MTHSANLDNSQDDLEAIYRALKLKLMEEKEYSGQPVYPDQSFSLDEHSYSNQSSSKNQHHLQDQPPIRDQSPSFSRTPTPRAQTPASLWNNGKKKSGFRSDSRKDSIPKKSRWRIFADQKKVTEKGQAGGDRADRSNVDENQVSRSNVDESKVGWSQVNRSEIDEILVERSHMNTLSEQDTLAQGTMFPSESEFPNDSSVLEDTSGESYDHLSGTIRKRSLGIEHDSVGTMKSGNGTLNLPCLLTRNSPFQQVLLR